MPSLKVKRPVVDRYAMSSPFGEREINGAKEFHKGIDFAVPVGTPVYAMVTGPIFRTGFEDPNTKAKGLGLRVWQEFLDLASGKTFYCWYGHLSEIFVEEGQLVEVGQPIGLSGNTGRSTGPHLHVQFRQKNTGEMSNAEFV